MAINKKLIHFNKKTTFNSQKLSANASNTQYQVGGTGTVQTGAPDINYQSIVYIKDSKEIWTHGQFYATAVTWSTITGKPSFATVATSGNYNDLSNKPTIPTKLPTPNVLTFTGAVTGTWDGSAAKTVNIPSGSSYTLPLASNSTRGTCISDEEAAYIILEGEEYYKKHYGSEKSIFKLHPTLKRLSKQQYQMNFTEVIIPKKVKKDILRQLSNIGISKSYLFPEMEYTAEYIKNKYIFGTQRLINGNFDADYEL